ncbi:MAG TPA: efflux RND transporter periplasmic adaptor subunit [Stellaceae bacterium]|nr:efflux RND transporter periplasmic adaptor subunit [Stellaceae bacterium]
MDGERVVNSGTGVIAPQRAERERIDGGRALAGRPKTLRWFAVMALLVALALGGLYGFNRFRQHAIANFFAHMKPPPAAVSAVTARLESVPRYAAGIGSLSAVRQVTVTPEVGGRVTKILFKSGATVKAGDLLVQLNDAPEQADLANYRAQAKLATLTLARGNQLAKRSFTPQQTVDQDQSTLDQANAEIAKTEAIIAQKAVRAPFSGQLGIRQVNLGQYLNAGATIVTLTDLDTLHVDFTLPSQLRAEIKVGQRLEVTADAFPDRVFHATITTIEPQISADTRTMTVQATMPNPQKRLLPGMFVNAAVVLPPRPDTVVLPRTAVDYTLYGDSVYVIRQAGKDAGGKPLLTAHRVAVKTGRQWGDKVAILSGLKAGEEVVAAGQLKVHEGGAVVVTGSPPPQPPAHPTLH